jgi:hypothetical protein
MDLIKNVDNDYLDIMKSTCKCDFLKELMKI